MLKTFCLNQLEWGCSVVSIDIEWALYFVHVISANYLLASVVLVKFVLHHCHTVHHTLLFFWGSLQESRWNFLFAFLAVPALLQLCVLPFLPESPRYLLMERKDEAGAEKGTVNYCITWLFWMKHRSKHTDAVHICKHTHKRVHTRTDI